MNMPDNGFQHLVAIKESTRKNLQEIQASLSHINSRKNHKQHGAVLSEPLLQQRKSKYRILKDKFIGQQVIKVLDYLNRSEAQAHKMSGNQLKTSASNLSDSSNTSKTAMGRGDKKRGSNLEFQTYKGQKGSKESMRYTTPSNR